MDIIGPVFGLVVSAWLLMHHYRLFRAFWFPETADDRARLAANVFGRRFALFLRWSSPFMLVLYALGVLLNFVLLVVGAWQRVGASTG
ncbi:hypothetical protein LK996_00760 [Lysobacter sp. A6]|uniref:Uncharacterized protein n=1 Tax=Noviluteimonas lactosilytica TaxID=2888523 RepID=A0ABS8JDH5_9GAMM|nr:hypothetical protein [Lysobacter lactosilyticus]MCC8361614.1 hypothetical protein [Lysobacter lactosilyticus]